MNQFIKYIIFIWLTTCALAIWIGMAIVGFFFAFTNWSIIYSFTPFIGLSAVICIMKCAMYVLKKSNPIAYLEEKTNQLRSLFGKEKI